MNSNSTPQSMGKNSKSNFTDLLKETVSEGKLPERTAKLLYGFYDGYRDHAINDMDEEEIDALFAIFLSKVCQQVNTPFEFEPYHERIRKPFDYYSLASILCALLSTSLFLPLQEL